MLLREIRTKLSECCCSFFILWDVTLQLLVATRGLRLWDKTGSAVLTIEVGNPHQLEDGNDDQRVGGCECVHQLQHEHPTLSQTHKYYKSSQTPPLLPHFFCTSDLSMIIMFTLAGTGSKEVTCMNPTLGWILPSEAVWGDFNKTQPLLFHSLSLSSEGHDYTLHAEICRLIQRKSRRVLGGCSSVPRAVALVCV